jgi:hypothetical protein
MGRSTVAKMACQVCRSPRLSARYKIRSKTCLRMCNPYTLLLEFRCRPAALSEEFIRPGQPPTAAAAATPAAVCSARQYQGRRSIWQQHTQLPVRRECLLPAQHQLALCKDSSLHAFFQRLPQNSKTYHDCEHAQALQTPIKTLPALCGTPASPFLVEGLGFHELMPISRCSCSSLL